MFHQAQLEDQSHSYVIGCHRGILLLLVGQLSAPSGCCSLPCTVLQLTMSDQYPYPHRHDIDTNLGGWNFPRIVRHWLDIILEFGRKHVAAT
jgi:hypothetical protein